MGCRFVTFSQLLAGSFLCVSSILGGVGGALLLGRRFEQAPQQPERQAPQQPERIVCKELQVESLVLVDHAGKQVGCLRANGANGATLMLGHGAGRPMAVLHIDEIEGTPSALLKLSVPEPAQPPAKPAAATALISLAAGWPRLLLNTASGRQIDLGSTIENPETALSVGEREGDRTKWPR